MKLALLVLIAFFLSSCGFFKGSYDPNYPYSRTTGKSEATSYKVKVVRDGESFFLTNTFSNRVYAKHKKYIVDEKNKTVYVLAPINNYKNPNVVGNSAILAGSNKYPYIISDNRNWFTKKYHTFKVKIVYKGESINIKPSKSYITTVDKNDPFTKELFDAYVYVKSTNSNVDITLEEFYKSGYKNKDLTQTFKRKLGKNFNGILNNKRFTFNEKQIYTVRISYPNSNNEKIEKDIQLQKFSKNGINYMLIDLNNIWHVK